MTDETAADAEALLAKYDLGPPSERFERGLARQRELDPAISEEVLAALADVAPDFGRLTIEFPFGDIYSRPGLDLKQRQITTMAALAALGQERQLKVHIRFARRCRLCSGGGPASFVTTCATTAANSAPCGRTQRRCHPRHADGRQARSAALATSVGAGTDD